MGNITSPDRKRKSLILIILFFIAALIIVILIPMMLNPTVESEIETPPPTSYMIEPTSGNYFDYQPGLECAAFSSAYILRHYGEEADGVEIFKTFPDKIGDSGAAPTGIVTFLSGRGYKIEFITEGVIADLKKLVSGGAPVIVFVHLTENDPSVHYTHYLPLVGYDEEYFYFAESLVDFANCKDEEGLPYNRKTKIADFEKLWANIDGVWDYPYFKILPKAI